MLAALSRPEPYCLLGCLGDLAAPRKWRRFYYRYIFKMQPARVPDLYVEGSAREYPVCDSCYRPCR